MPDSGALIRRVAALGRRLAGVPGEHRNAIVVGSAVGTTMGETAIGMLYVLTYVWPWSVLIGCEQ